MGFISQNGIPHIIIMGYLDLIKKDHIFQFCRVANNSPLSYQSISPDKSAMAYLCVFPNDCRPVNIGSRSYFR